MPAGTIPIDEDDSSRVHSLQRYMQGQLSRESSFMESLRVRDEATKLLSLQSFMRGQLSRAPSSVTPSAGIQNQSESQPSSSSGIDPDAEKAILRELQRFMRAQLSRQNSMVGEDDTGDEETLKTAYLQGYLRGQLSRENSSSEASPLLSKRGNPFGSSDEVEDIEELLYFQRYLRGQLSRQNSGSESGSPLSIRRGALFGNESEGDSVDGASPSFTGSPGMPLSFRAEIFFLDKTAHVVIIAHYSNILCEFGM